jgi:hypothetical protein
VKNLCKGLNLKGFEIGLKKKRKKKKKNKTNSASPPARSTSGPRAAQFHRAGPPAPLPSSPLSLSARPAPPVRIALYLPPPPSSPARVNRAAAGRFPISRASPSFKFAIKAQ